MVRGVWPTRAYVHAWLSAFLLTELVEAPVYRVFARTSWTVALVASAITHPFVWFVFPFLGLELDLPWAATATVSELFAWIVEAAWLVLAGRRGFAPPTSSPRALVVSLVANAASVAVGFVTRSFFDWP
jgi:hypothetical protein